MSASHDDEQALERLLRASRTDPGDAQLRRLEGRFDAWLAETAPTKGSTAWRWFAPLGTAFLALGVGLVSVASRSDQARTGPTETPSIVAVDHVAMAAAPSRPVRKTPAQDVAALPAPPAVRVPTTAPLRATAPLSPDVAAEQPPPVAPATTPASTGSLESSETEVSYLRRTRSTLKSDPSRALEMANGHPSRFPHGALDQERELIAIDALGRLGRTDEARARADAFRSRYPSSAHLGRVNVLTSGAP